MVPSMSGDDGLLMGIDAGTQSVKACLWTPDGRRVARGAASLEVRTAREGFAEQDPEAWWRSCRTAIRTAIEGVAPARVRAIGLAFQRESFTLTDARGRFLRPAILWLDVRCAEQVRRLGEQLGRTAYHERTGKPLDVTSAPARLAWLGQHEPETLAGAAGFADVCSVLAERLTGRRATCPAGADTCGLVDLTRREWIGEYLPEPLGATALPELVSSGEPIGAVSGDAAEATGLAAGTPVVAAGGDGHVFGVGCGASRPGAMTLSLGTSIVLGVRGEAPTLGELFRTLIAPGGGYLYECVLQSGAYVLRWFARRFGGDEAIWGSRAAEVPPGCDGLLTLPQWWGVRFPSGLDRARGAMLGLTDRHGPAEMYRSLLEGLSLEVRRMLQALRERAGDVRDRVALGGGGAASALWTQMLADVLGCPIRPASEAETVSLGAAVLAGVGVGRWRLDEGVEAMVRTRDAVPPRPNERALYERLYRERYIPAFEAVLPLTVR